MLLFVVEFIFMGLVLYAEMLLLLLLLPRFFMLLLLMVLLLLLLSLKLLLKLLRRHQLGHFRNCDCVVGLFELLLFRLVHLKDVRVGVLRLVVLVLLNFQ
jgi:hypothetical protein